MREREDLSLFRLFPLSYAPFFRVCAHTTEFLSARAPVIAREVLRAKQNEPARECKARFPAALFRFLSRASVQATFWLFFRRSAAARFYSVFCLLFRAAFERVSFQSAIEKERERDSVLLKRRVI